jgi:hypothetical protein
MVIAGVPLFDLERAAGERLPAPLEDLPFRGFEAVEGDVGQHRRPEIVPGEPRQRPLLVRLRHDEDVAPVGLTAPHEIEQVLQVRAVLAERRRLELAGEVDALGIEGEHASRPPG